MVPPLGCSSESIRAALGGSVAVALARFGGCAWSTLRCAAQSPDPAVLQATTQDGSILPPKPSPTTQRQQVRGERADSKARKDAAMAKYTENMDTLGDAIGNAV